MRKIRKEQNGKVRQLLLKYFLKYFLILLIALTGSLLIVLRACQLTERNIIEENTWKLERGVDELEDQMLRMENVAETLRIAQGIRYLDRLEGSLSNEGYVELNYARESLLNASIMSDFAELTFVLFQENDCFVSEAQSAASFSQYYGEFLEAAGMDAEEFRKTIFSFHRKVNFLQYPELRYSKYYETETEKNPVLCVVYPSEGEIQNFSGEGASMAVVFVIQENTILDMLVSGGRMEVADLTLRYYNNEPFFKYEAPEEKWKKADYREISAIGMEEMLYVNAAFSQEYFYEYVFELTGILLVYLVVGFAAACILAFFFAGKQYRNMQGLISRVVSSDKENGRIRNEFDLLGNSIQQLSQNRDEYRTKVALLENQMKNAQKELSREYGMYFCSGLSTVGTGLENIKRCYNQALEALLTFEDGEENRTATWHMLKHDSAWHSPVDLESMQKLYQLILYGETQASGALFDHMLDQYRRNVPAFELKREEIFYAIRNILTGLLGQQIFEGSAVRLPEYRRDWNFPEMILELKKAAMELCGGVEEKRHGKNERLKKELLEYLNTSYMDSSLTAAGISRETGISEKLLFQLIKEATGCTLAEYLENIRLQHAQELLLGTRLSNAEIAERVGFGHVNTFYRVFSKRKGISPARFRRNDLESRESRMNNENPQKHTKYTIYEKKCYLKKKTVCAKNMKWCEKRKL